MGLGSDPPFADIYTSFSFDIFGSKATGLLTHSTRIFLSV